MTIIKTLRDAIAAQKEDPHGGKVMLSPEHANMLEAELIRLNAAQATEAAHRAQFEAECG